MAKTSKNILGDQRGKIGKVVGKVVDGVQMYSAYTDAVKNPRTAKQVSHRARFAAAIALGKAVKGALKIGFREEAAKRKLTSAFNIFVKTNMPKVSYDAETHTTTCDYEHIVLADGEVPAVAFTGVTFPEALTVTATFNGNADVPGAYDADSVYLVVYSPTLERSTLGIGTRVSGTVTVTLPSEWGGETVQVWGFVKTSVEDTTEIESYGITLQPASCSVSSYVGSGQVTE